MKGCLEKSQVTSDKLLDSPSKLPCFFLVKYRENLTLKSHFNGALFRAPLQMWSQHSIILIQLAGNKSLTTVCLLCRMVNLTTLYSVLANIN